MADRLVIERALSRLEAVQHALAIKKVDEKRMEQGLINMYVRVQDLEMNNHIAACQQSEAEARAENLQEEVESLKNQIAFEVAARKSAESARRASDSFAASYRDLYQKARAAWHCSQRIVYAKEKELVAAEGDYSRLQHRLEEVRKGNEMDLLELDLAAEGLGAEESPPYDLDAVIPLFKNVQCQNADVMIIRRETEGRVVGGIKTLSLSQAMILEEGGPDPGTQVQLGTAKSAMSAKISASAVQQKTQRLQARIRVFKMRERNRESVAVPP